MTAFALDVPRAAQPRLSSIPSFHHTSADEVFAFLDWIGMPLLDWQRFSLAATLGETEAGRWAAPWVLELCPRQNGKSYKWAARVLAGLFVLNEELICYTAHTVKTALEVYRIVEQYIRATPELRRRTAHIVHTQGREYIELFSGQRFMVVPRVRSAGRGYSGDCLIMDEALELRDSSAMNALVPTLAARRNPQLIFTSSAGDPGSVVLRDLRMRGQSNPGDMTYLEYSAPESASTDDESAWATANPALGELIGIDTMRRARQIMSEEGFRVEHMGIWSSIVAGGVISSSAWADTARDVDADPLPGLLGLAFDVTPDRSWGSVVTAYNVGERVHMRMARHRLGDGWLFNDLRTLTNTYGVPVTYDAQGPGRDIAEALRLGGVPVAPVSGRDFAAGCARLLSGIVNTTITHHPDLALDEAAAIATTRRIGESWAFARKAGETRTPLSPLTAAVLAVWACDHLRDMAPAPRPEVY